MFAKSHFALRSANCSSGPLKSERISSIDRDSYIIAHFPLAAKFILTRTPGLVGSVSNRTGPYQKITELFFQTSFNRTGLDAKTLKPS